MFADDQIVIAHDEDSLQKALFKLSYVSKDYNLKISTTKTKVLALKGKLPIRNKIVIENQIIEQITNFNYLGCNVGMDRELDINRKISRYQQFCGTITRTLLGKCQRDTLLKFYKVIAIPMLMYGAECWTLTEIQRNRVEVAEMRFLRAVAGYRRSDRKRNEDIRVELGVTGMCSMIRAYQENWLQHLNNMTDQRIPKAITAYQPTGKRTRGRPVKRWRDQFLPTRPCNRNRPGWPNP